jgi:hypothetical protein
MKQSKVTKKNHVRDRSKTQAVNWTASKFKVTSAYVYGVLAGTFNSGIADEIKKSFNEKYNELKIILE